MRRIGFLSFVFIMAALVSCQKENADSSLTMREAILTATIDGEETKTYMSSAGNDIYHVLWSAGDQIGVFTDDLTSMNLYTLTEGAGTQKASFTGYGIGSRYVAFYPASCVQSRNGDNVSVSLPTRQEYFKDSFGKGTFPMAAVSNSDNLSFRNICSVLKLSMTGHHYIDSIVFRPQDKSRKVSGQGTVSTGTAVLTMSSQGKDNITLITKGQSLDEDKATDFYIAVPPGTYKGGFSVRVYASTGYMDKVFSKDFTFERSRVHPADLFQFKIEGGTDMSTCLEGQGTESNPFRVSSLEDLLLVKAAVNSEGKIKAASGGSVDAVTAAYVMTKDIDLSSICGKARETSWIPIGNNPSIFNGTFDGGGNKISHLYIESKGIDGVGFFGRAGTQSVISNLVVEGEVVCSGQVGTGLVIGISQGVVEGCTSYGSVRGPRYVGGTVGHSDDGYVRHCVNYADVSGNEYAGGVIGWSFLYGPTFCINYGTVTAEYGFSIGGVAGGSGGPGGNNTNYGVVTAPISEWVGGVYGYLNNDELFNCRNEGKVVGGMVVGGIAGVADQRERIYNCLNLGDVSGNEYVGGVCGKLLSFNSISVIPSIRNCVNLGAVVSKDKNVGGICGYVGGGEGYKVPEVEGNYWLYDPEKDLGMAAGIGVSLGKEKNNHALTEAQMKGEALDEPLYKNYVTLLDALNSWAFTNMDSGEIPLQGWAYLTPGEYPSLTGIKATAPGQGNSLISLGKSYYEVMADASEIQVEVSSLVEYSVSSSEWIRESGIQCHEETAPNLKVYTFTVDKNNTSEARSGKIVLKTADGASLSCTVEQSAPFLKVMPEQLPFVADGASKRVLISSSVMWKALSSEAWCKVSPEKGIESTELTITAEANESTSVRDAVVRIVSEDESLIAEVIVHQYGKHPYMTVTPREVSLSARGESKRINISSNMDWKVLSDQEWCVVTPETGSGSGLISISAGENNSTMAREATILISSIDGAFESKISVAQSGREEDGEGEQGDWRIQAFYHQSLAMRFTATWCGFCPMMSHAVEQAQEKYPDKLIHLALHTRNSKLEFDQIASLENLYSITTYPSGVVDGRAFVSNASDVSITVANIEKAMLETEQYYEATTGMAINSSISGQTVNVDLKAYLREAGRYKITVLLVEDGIMNEQVDNIDGNHTNYIHDNVARMALTDVLGNEFSVSGDYSVKDFHYEVSVPSSYVLQNMRVLAYIQAEFGDRTRIQSNSSYGDFFVDNCATAPLGTSLGLALVGSGSGGSGGGNEGINPGDDINM